MLTIRHVPTSADSSVQMATETEATEGVPLVLDQVIGSSPHRDRYGRVARYLGGTLVGVIAGLLLIESIGVGVGWGLEGHNPPDWDILKWGDHWLWRAIASAVATAAASFLAGMVARRREGFVALACTVPSVAYWSLVVWIGWTGQSPFSSTEAYIPMGYRIVALILAVALLPIARFSGVVGAAYGRANSQHFDARRASLFGVRWFHFLWLPFLIHFMVITAAFGAVQGFQFFLVAWRNAMSLIAAVPSLLYLGMFFTLQILGTGAFRTYEALAGFSEDSNSSVGRRVLKYGFGYTAGAALAQSAISLLVYGLHSLAAKLHG